MYSLSLKRLAISVMVIFHTLSMLLVNNSCSTSTTFTYITIFTFPIYAVLISNDWKYTNNRLAYLKKLLLLGLLSQIPYTLFFNAFNRHYFEAIEPKNILFLNYQNLQLHDIVDILYKFIFILCSILIIRKFVVEKYERQKLQTLTIILGTLTIIELKINYIYIISPGSLNVIYTLIIGIFFICFWSKIIATKNYDIYLIILFTIASITGLLSLNLEYTIWGSLLILLIHILSDKKKLFFLVVISGVLVGSFTMNISTLFLGLFAITPATIIYLNHGSKEGLMNDNSMFFWIYPIHMLLLGLIINLA